MATKKAAKKSATKTTGKRATQARKSKKKGFKADPPITIKGGGSFYIEFETVKFNKTGNKYKHKKSGAILRHLILDGGDPIELSEDSAITISYFAPED